MWKQHITFTLVTYIPKNISENMNLTEKINIESTNIIYQLSMPLSLISAKKKRRHSSKVLLCWSDNEFETSMLKV